MIDTKTVRSPGWWLIRLAAKLQKSKGRFDMLESYLDGSATVPVSAITSTRESYTRLMRMARTNYAELAVEAVRERMMPVGFRTGAVPDGQGDDLAWQAWQANSLDADCDLIHAPMLGLGAAYAIVGETDPDIEWPIVTPEDPRQVVCAYDPRRRRRVIAALKHYVDVDEGVERAYVYLPAGAQSSAGATVHQFVRAARFGADDADDTADGSGGWEVAGDVQVLTVPDVPVVAFLNRPDIDYCPTAEIEPHLGQLDRINYGLLTRLEIATMQAYKQRAIKGIPLFDADGQEIDYDKIFEPGPAALWQLPETAEMWESGAVDLTPVITAGESDVKAFAAVTRTPLFYLSPEGTNGSAEGAALSREGLIFKVGDRIRNTSESWEQVMSLVFAFKGDAERARRADTQVIWAPPERYSLSERYDAASKAQAAGVPWETVMRDVLQFSPQEVDRMRQQRAGDALMVRMGTPGSPDAPAAGGPLTPKELADTIQSLYLGVDKVITADEARAILNQGGAGLTGPGPTPVG